MANPQPTVSTSRDTEQWRQHAPREDAHRPLQKHPSASTSTATSSLKVVRSHDALDDRSLPQVLSIIQSASDALHDLNEGKREAEAQLLRLREQTREELNTIEARLQSVERLLAEAEDRADAAEQWAQETEARALMAEEQVHRMQERAEAAEHEAQVAREWLTRFRDAVMSAFGPHQLKRG